MSVTALRDLGPHPGLQIVPTRDDSDLVAFPVDFVAGKHTMQFHGGPTISKPNTILIWCGPPSVDRAQFERFAYELVAFGFLSKLSYAECTSGVWYGSFDGPALTPGRTYLDSELQTYLRTWLTTHPEAKQPNSSTIYSLMLPSGVAVQFDGTTDKSCTSFCGYHSSLDNGNILYTVEPATDCSGCNQGDPFVGQTMVYSHEIAETVSDPTGQGWYENSTGMENGDICAWIAKKYGPWTVQGYADPAGNNVQGDYVQPAPTPQGCQEAALAAADEVIDGYKAGVEQNSRSTKARYLLQGAQAVRFALTALPA